MARQHRYGTYEYWQEAVREQTEWMARCGGTLAGYVAKYGSASDAEHSGDGGEAIYAADYRELERVTQRMRCKAWQRQNRRR